MDVRLNKLFDKHKALIIRIACVTDNVLREQLQEECVELENSIHILESQLDAEKLELKRLEKEHKQRTFDATVCNIVKEHKDYYNTQFVKENDLIYAVEITNNIRNLTQKLSKHRLRRPMSLKQRRELYVVASTLKWCIEICDMEGYVVDEISPTVEYTSKIKIYINVFSRWGDYNSDTAMCEIVIPKYCLNAPFL